MLYGARVFMALLPVCYYAARVRADCCQDALDKVNLLSDKLDALTNQFKQLSRHVMLRSHHERERITSEGTSGIVKVRDYTVGPNSFNFANFVGQSFANIHDHANHEKVYGLGDFQMVMNGVFFRTRHSDFELRRAADTNEWLATVPIELPPLPDGLESMSIDNQINEMKEYIRAFQLQDESIKPYKEFFKPVLCYLEGWWAANTVDIENGFTSLRLQFNAKSWKDMIEKARADLFLGSDFTIRHDDASLPTTILGVNETSGEITYGQWNYRVLCHQIHEDVPTSYFKPVEDLAFRTQSNISEDNFHLYKAARYVLDDSPVSESKMSSILDRYVEKIPGLDNVPEDLDEDLYNRPKTAENRLGFYNRAYKSERDSLYCFDQLRGFSDGNVFVALNTQENVAPLKVTQCVKDKGCVDSEVRASWLVPIEVIYVTPLQRWNPYNLPHSSDPKWSNYAQGMDGRTESKAYLGSHDRNFYRIPFSMFSSGEPNDKNGADAYSNARYVKNNEGVVTKMIASGPKAILPPIEGVGEVRLRYPIMPVHEEGSGSWKELNGFINFLAKEFEALSTEDEQE